ncbi:PREDICTED: PRUPE_7G045600 [Prunus dulcis]|uniref:PREDICTED: PRUPE_7G045600 n=1 Tax=Prunus dulcis TaxID=3755 RepID=A0A5E4EZH1_PRUDU|nr:PREDICTED: PRUPE_7G045600 [Prunus dulcis]
MNRADPASKRLAPRQPRLLPCQRKTHFRGARHLPKLPTAKPNLQDMCRHHNDLHKVLYWNFVQSSYFHLPINREQYPSKKGNYSPSFTVSHQPISPRASALFPAEDPAHLITKLNSILAGPF